MKKLAIEFTERGFSFKQIQREGNIAIYKRCKNEEDIHFEVIKIQNHNGIERFGKYYPASEYYPSSNQWGIDGFTYNDLESTSKRFENLVNLEKQKYEKANKL